MMRYTDKRLQTIRSAIKDTGKLKLVPSKLNPADIGTRGMSPKTLVENKPFWFNGPRFLELTEKSWPNLHIGDNFADVNRYSSPDKLLKVTGYVIKFKNKWN